MPNEASGSNQPIRHQAVRQTLPSIPEDKKKNEKEEEKKKDKKINPINVPDLRYKLRSYSNLRPEFFKPPLDMKKYTQMRKWEKLPVKVPDVKYNLWNPSTLFPEFYKNKKPLDKKVHMNMMISEARQPLHVEKKSLLGVKRKQGVLENPDRKVHKALDDVVKQEQGKKKVENHRKRDGLLLLLDHDEGEKDKKAVRGQ